MATKKKKVAAKKTAAKKKATKKKTKKKTTQAKKTTTTQVTSETGRWNGHKFTVSPTLIRGFSGLSIEGSCEITEKTKSKQQYASRKRGNPTDISITVHLNAFTGCDVRTEAMKFVDEAAKGKCDYFYVGSKKLTTYKLLLHKASVKDVEISQGQKWTRADVQLTFKQNGKGGTSDSKSKKKTTKKKSSSSGSGGSSSSGYSSSGYSSYSGYSSSGQTNTSSSGSSGSSLGSKIIGAAKTAISNTANAVKSATSTISSLISAAKTYTASKK